MSRILQVYQFWRDINFAQASTVFSKHSSEPFCKIESEIVRTLFLFLSLSVSSLSNQRVELNEGNGKHTR